MGFIMKDWMARHGLGGKAASLVLGTSEATVSRAVHGVAGDQLARTALSLDGLATQLASMDKAGVEVLVGMADRIRGKADTDPWLEDLTRAVRQVMSTRTRSGYHFWNEAATEAVVRAIELVPDVTKLIATLKNPALVKKVGLSVDSRAAVLENVLSVKDRLIPVLQEAIDKRYPRPAMPNLKLLMGYRGDGSPFEWDIDGHILAVGPSGSGHTASLLLPNFERYRGRMVVMDCRDEITDEMVAIRQALTGRKCVVVRVSPDPGVAAPQDYVDPQSDVVLRMRLNHSTQQLRTSIRLSERIVSRAAGMLVNIASEVTSDQPAVFWFDHDTQDAFWEFDEFVDFLEEGGDEGCTVVMCLHHLGALDHSLLRHFRKVAVIGGGSFEYAECLSKLAGQEAEHGNSVPKPVVTPGQIVCLPHRNLIAIGKAGTATKLVKAFPQSFKDRCGHPYPAMADVLKEAKDWTHPSKASIKKIWRNIFG